MLLCEPPPPAGPSACPLRAVFGAFDEYGNGRPRPIAAHITLVDLARSDSGRLKYGVVLSGAPPKSFAPEPTSGSG